MTVLLVPLGEAATLFGFDPATGVAGVALALRQVTSAGIQGLVDVVPAPPQLLVRFDPLTTSRRALEAAVLQAIATVEPAAAAAPGANQVPVVYGGGAGPDLDAAAERLGLPPEALVRRHLSVTYTVSSTGFAPGFVYLDGLDPGLRLPRRDEPRPHVAPGSVAIAEGYSGIYAAGTGGGWWLIGTTSLQTFDPAADPPSPFAIGDSVTFVDAT